MNQSVVVAVVLVMAFFALAYTVGLYNGLVRLKHGVGKAWANIDVLLRQRNEELPKLVETCKQYMRYEQATLERVIAARNAVASASREHDMQALGRAESGLRAGLGQLFALAENYPQLKADERFRHLQQRISDLENGIADRRELYNEAVNLNNVRIEQFPDVLLARLFGFTAATLLRFSEAEKADVDLKALFG